MPTSTTRAMVSEDRFEVAELIYASINIWYQQHGLPLIFVGGPRITEIFYDVYHALAPGCAVVAEAPDTRAPRKRSDCARWRRSAFVGKARRKRPTLQVPFL